MSEEHDQQNNEESNNCDNCIIDYLNNKEKCSEWSLSQAKDSSGSTSGTSPPGIR